MKFYDQLKKFLLVLWTIFWFTLAGSAVGQTRVRLATLLPRGTSQYQALERMGQQWKADTHGAITLTIYADGTAGSEAESIQKLRVGSLQAVTLSAASLADLDSYLGAIEKVPMLFHSLEESEYVRDKVSPLLEKRLESQGFVVLFWADAGWIQLFSRQPILRPADLKNTRLLTTPGDPAEVELIKMLGIKPEQRVWSEAFLGLQTGNIDELVTTPFLCLAGQFDRTAKHYLPLNYVPLAGATIISKQFWESLTAEQRDAMHRAAVEAGREIQASSRAENQKSIEAMKSRGLQVHAMTPEAEREWQQYFEAVYPQVRGKLVPADIFDEVQQVLSDYRSGSPSQRGHGK